MEPALGDPPTDLPVRFDHHAWEVTLAGPGPSRDERAVRWVMVVVLTVFLIGGAAVTIPIAGVYGYGVVVAVFMGVVLLQDRIVDRFTHGRPRTAVLRCEQDTLTIDGVRSLLSAVQAQRDGTSLRINGPELDWSFEGHRTEHVRWLAAAITEARAELPPPAPEVPVELERLRAMEPDDRA